MPGLMGYNKPVRRLVLGFDGACSTCGELAYGIRARSGDKLEVLSLHDPRVVAWRGRTLGEHSPLVPALFEVEEAGEVRAYTGLRLGARLARSLGPVTAWCVLQEMGEVRGASGGGGYPGGFEPTRTVGLTRGQLLKGVGGAAVAVSVLSAGG